MPEISVVIPLYNGEEYLRIAMDSVLNQTFSDFEVLIVCEYGTNQESLDIVREYASNDSRIKLIYNTRKLGISASLNVGLRAATGKYIARMDGDDLCGLNRFEEQKRFMDTYPEIGMLGIAPTILNSPKWLVDYVADPDQIASELLLFVPLKHPTVMFRRELVEQCLYDETLAGVEDYDFFCKIGDVTKISNLLDPTLFYYRRTGDNASSVNAGRDNIIWQGTQRRFFKEKLGLDFSRHEVSVLNLLSEESYKKQSKDKYYKIFTELESLLTIIEDKNDELGIYRPECLRQTLKHRWFREKYKVEGMLKKNIPGNVINTWRTSKYYSPWF